MKDNPAGRPTRCRTSCALSDCGRRSPTQTALAGELRREEDRAGIFDAGIGDRCLGDQSRRTLARRGARCSIGQDGSGSGGPAGGTMPMRSINWCRRWCNSRAVAEFPRRRSASGRRTAWCARWWRSAGRLRRSWSRRYGPAAGPTPTDHAQSAGPHLQVADRAGGGVVSELHPLRSGAMVIAGALRPGGLRWSLTTRSGGARRTDAGCALGD